MGHKHKAYLAAQNDEISLGVQDNGRASIELDWVPVTGDTIQFEAQSHPEGTWDAIEGFLMSDIDGTGATSATNIGIWLFDVRAISRLRASASALGSTPVLVKMYAE